MAELTNKYPEISKEEAENLIGLEFTDGWNFYTIQRENKLSGIVLIKGSELHCWRHPDFNGRWLVKKDIQDFLGSLINTYGKATTCVMSSNNTGHKFVQRLGFKRTEEKGQITYYEMERLNHA